MPQTRNKTYFASDVHLGAPYIKNPKEHEARFVRWLDSIKNDAEAIYLVGDIFDFWWEYKKVVPRGFVRTLGKLAELTDAGIPIHFFIGNHDIWTWDYLSDEVGLKVYKKAAALKLQGKNFYISHGDEIGDHRKSFKIMRAGFHSPILQKLFSFFIHPNLAMRIGQKWSGSSRKTNNNGNTASYWGEDKEFMVVFAKQTIQTKHFDYFVFGHRHIVLDLMIRKDSRVIILGDWIGKFSYGVLEKGNFHLEYFEAD